MRARAAACLPLLVLSAALPAAGQAAGEADGVEAREPFVESVDVHVVNVEVYVTDKEGRPVTGLTRDDFELEVDRRPLAITNFYAVRDGVAARPMVEGLAGEPRLRAAVAPPAVPESQRLFLVIYIDNFNIHPLHRNRALGAARSFLRSRLAPGDLVMLVTSDRSVKVQQPFTADTELILSALDEVEKMSGSTVQFEAERRKMLALIYDADDIVKVRGRAKQYAQSIRNDLRFTLGALQRHVEALAGLPGRKAILHLSNGISLRAGEDVFRALNDRFPDDSSVLMESFAFDMSGDFEALTRQANANRVTFYTLDAAGLRVYTYSDASNRGPGGYANIDEFHQANVQQPLRLMAQETGGLAILDTNDFRPYLNRMAEDFGSYYSLGFTPASADAGRYHHLQVKLKHRRKGITVRHRDGYRGKSVSARMTDAVTAALDFGLKSNALGVEAEALEAIRRDDGDYLVSVAVKVPIKNLSLVPDEEAYRGRVRLFVAVRDHEGGSAPTEELEERVDIPRAEIDHARQQLYHFQLTLLMRRGDHVVAVGARDEIGGNTGFATRGIKVGGQL